jgi:hypothetical protein
MDTDDPAPPRSNALGTVNTPSELTIAPTAGTDSEESFKAPDKPSPGLSLETPKLASEATEYVTGPDNSAPTSSANVYLKAGIPSGTVSETSNRGGRAVSISTSNTT